MSIITRTTPEILLLVVSKIDLKSPIIGVSM